MALLRPLLALLSAPLPGELRSRLLGLVGWSIDPSAEIGLSWVAARDLRMGPRSRIGHLCLIERIGEVAMAERALIGTRIRVRGTDEGEGSLRLGPAASLVSGHFIDAGAGVEFGKYATLAGRDSQLWTHHWRRRAPERSLERAPVRIGERAYVGSRAILLPGVVLSEGVAVGAGSVVTAGAADRCRAGGMLSGNPAEPREES